MLLTKLKAPEACLAEYQLVRGLPKELETSLPSIEQIEQEMGEVEV